jgi:hypothetical protein
MLAGQERLDGAVLHGRGRPWISLLRAERLEGLVGGDLANVAGERAELRVPAGQRPHLEEVLEGVLDEVLALLREIAPHPAPAQQDVEHDGPHLGANAALEKADLGRRITTQGTADQLRQIGIGRTSTRTPGTHDRPTLSEAAPKIHLDRGGHLG